MTIYKDIFDINLPRTSRQQSKLGDVVKNYEFGDLLFFNTRGRRISHVGMYVDSNIFIHASTKNGVKYSSLDEKYYKHKFVFAKRILE